MLTVFKNLDVFSQVFIFFTLFICILISLWPPKISKNNLMCLILFSICSVSAFMSSKILYIYFWMETANVSIFIMLFKDCKLNVTLQFMIYTLVSACIVLIGILYHASWLLFLGIAIKIPIWPFYYWLPTVHSGAPTICSILLASIILKFSSLMLIRTQIEISLLLQYIICFGVLCASCQMRMHKNLKTIVSYSSIIHMGMYLFLLPKLNDFTFCLLQHSITISCAFFVLDKIKRKYKTLNINELIIDFNDWLLLMLTILILIGIPFSYGFISECITIICITKSSILCSLIICLSLLIEASYLVYVLSKIEIMQKMSILQQRENRQNYILCLLFLVIFTIGIFPKLFYKTFC